MIKNKAYIANLLAVFNFGSDIGIAIITVSLFSRFFSFELSPVLVALSIAFSLLPDIDMFVELPLRILKKIRPEQVHQVYTHFPLMYLPLGVIILFISLPIGLLFFVNITLHFLHDSFGTSWGIAWLYPLKRDYYKFFADEFGSISKNLIQVWTPEERENLRIPYGDEYWMENLYLNSWTMKNIVRADNGPPIEWLKKGYRKVRWMYYVEILLTLTGLCLLLKIV